MLLLTMLRNEPDAVARNELALEISKTMSVDVLPVLVELIQRPALKDCRGTLVHCMASFDCSKYFGLFVDLVISGGWEVANEAFGAFEGMAGVSKEQALAGYKALLAAKSANLEDWRSSLIAELISMFE